MGKSTGSLKWAERKVFSTGEAAEICGVSKQTIIRAFDGALLQGFRVPGSRDRRIPRAELIRFMADNAIPTDALENALKRIVIASEDPDACELIAGLFDSHDRVDEPRRAKTGFELGRLVERERPHLLILDLEMPGLDVPSICRNLRSDQECRGTAVMVLLGNVRQEDIQQLGQAQLAEFIRKPIEPGQLLEMTELLLGLRAAEAN